ncbi:hypothetical protein WMY93_031210 [Mugilogobius chulae]|uniref:Cadherin domain-containing protein n=1 Tax=Mugilogobius chulae TaxID=88201 RepID=A0AAW0MJ66_9GOBI
MIGREKEKVQAQVQKMEKEENAVVWYSLLPGPGYELFSINPYTGLITTTSYLDPEEQQHYTLRVQARDSSSRPLSSTSTVLCSVLDDNDNPPEFMQSSFQISLPENLPPGLIHTVQASDPDHGENGTIHYSIQGKDTLCIIEDTSDNYKGRFTIDTFTGAISTTQILDREETRITPSSSRPTTTAPTPSAPPPRSIEGLPAGSEVVQLSAFDQDEGPNGEITYSLTEDNSQGAFSVDPFTGTVRTTKPLDRESRSQYSVRVVASDSCTQGPLTSAVSLTILVEDVNDNAPVCTHNPVNAWVSMTTLPNQVVSTVRATDEDRGENGTVRFMISDEENLFDINGDTGRGRPPLTSTCLVFVHLLGERERLQFTEREYNATVKENSRAGTWITKVEASDSTNSRQRITYTIFSGNENNMFSINRHTGEIRVQKDNSLDFELSASIQLVVLADSGLQSAHCRVSISLQDVNDNAPVFEHNSYRTAVWEGQVHNTYVMQVFASDADSGLNEQITYSIISGNNNNAFILDSVRGILATNVMLDREITSSYKLVLQAADKGSPPFSSTATVRVQVVDVNDNSPTIPPMEPVLIPENLPAGYMVTQVIANDVDLSSTITYSFTDDDSSSSPFAIDCYTGVITLTKALDYETQTDYVLTVRASDSLHHTTGEVRVQVLDVNDNAPVFTQVSTRPRLWAQWRGHLQTAVISSTRLLHPPTSGVYFHQQASQSITNSNVVHLLVEARDQGDPIRSSVASVEVLIVDNNDHAPLFHQDIYTLTVAEDTPTDTTLLTLSADDEDWSPENTHLDYAIVGGNEEKRFCLEVKLIQVENQLRNVAKLVLCNPLDRETTEAFSLTVSVSDRGRPPLNTVNHSLDYEEDSKYTLTVRASDGSESSDDRNVAFAVIYVTVLDENDNSPYFMFPTVNCSVHENLPAFTHACSIHAIDDDSGPYGLLAYSILTSCFMDYAIGSPDRKEAFGIDSHTGEIVTRQTFNYENENEYCFVVEARDKGDKAATIKVQVSIKGVDEFSPNFYAETVLLSARGKRKAWRNRWLCDGDGL